MACKRWLWPSRRKKTHQVCTDAKARAERDRAAVHHRSSIQSLRCCSLRVVLVLVYLSVVCGCGGVRRVCLLCAALSVVFEGE
jgi:hypothetical protein